MILFLFLYLSIILFFLFGSFFLLLNYFRNYAFIIYIYILCVYSANIHYLSLFLIFLYILSSLQHRGQNLQSFPNEIEMTNN